MIRHLLLALALAAGVSSAAQAQQVFTVASCSATGVSNAPGTTGRFYAGPDGVLCVSGGGGSGGAANPYPGSDYATSARQDAQTAALGAPADAAYAGSGNAGNVALGKGQYAVLANLLASLGATGDAQAANSSATASLIALTKYNALVSNTAKDVVTTIRDRTRVPLAGTNRSTTVGTTAVTLMAANSSRGGWRIKNDTSGDVWINFDATATAVAGGGNIKIAAGSSMTSEPGFVETGAMSAIGSAAGLNITAREY